MVLNRFIIFLIANLVMSGVSYATEQYIIKFATLIPPGTAWMNEIEQWSNELHQKSNGRIRLKIYPGGVMGDEPDVLRKLRSRQLQGAFFTGYGIGRIYSPARVLEVPFLFRSLEESDYVRDKLMPEIETGFRDRGFELLGWPEVGFIHFFSKHSIASLEELKRRRLWIWQGDPMGEALADAAGISPTPLSIIDVYTQLSAKYGSIDTVFNSPFGVLAMQWHTKLKYASNIPATKAIGCLVVSNRFFNRLPDDLKSLLKTTGKAVGEKINTISRRDNKKSIDLLKNNGMVFMWDWNESEKNAMLEIRDKAATELSKTNYIPESYFIKTREMVEDYRQHKAEK